MIKKTAGSSALGVAFALVAVLATVQVAQAEDRIRMFKSVPSVDELRRSLTPERTIKTRAITFGGGSATPAAAAPPPAAETVGMPVEFAYDSAQVLPEALPFLDQIGRLLQEDAGLALVVEGHTDGKGSATYNKILSMQRARSVTTYLSNAYGIPAERLQPVGMGEARPLVKDPMAAENRRVQFRRLN